VSDLFIRSQSLEGPTPAGLQSQIVGMREGHIIVEKKLSDHDPIPKAGRTTHPSPAMLSRNTGNMKVYHTSRKRAGNAMDSAIRTTKVPAYPKSKEIPNPERIWIMFNLLFTRSVYHVFVELCTSSQKKFQFIRLIVYTVLAVE